MENCPWTEICPWMEICPSWKIVLGSQFYLYLVYSCMYLSCMLPVSDNCTQMSRPLLVHGIRLLNLSGVNDWHKPVLYTVGQVQEFSTAVHTTGFSTSAHRDQFKSGKEFTPTIGKPVITIPVPGNQLPSNLYFFAKNLAWRYLFKISSIHTRKYHKLLRRKPGVWKHRNEIKNRYSI